jgi:hypothetical protein
VAARLMERKLTRKEAEEAFQAVAALRDEIAFGWLAEGCECRAQLMIEHLQAMGLEPGRAWAISVGRMLAFPQANRPGHYYHWQNHVAPTVAVEEVEQAILVIDPSLSPAGPLDLLDWVQILRVRSVHLSDSGLSEAEVMTLQRERVLQGGELDAVVFNLRLGQPPLTNLGGSGFRIGPDPHPGVSMFAHRQMLRLLDLQNQMGS